MFFAWSCFLCIYIQLYYMDECVALLFRQMTLIACGDNGVFVSPLLVDAAFIEDEAIRKMRELQVRNEQPVLSLINQQLCLRLGLVEHRRAWPADRPPARRSRAPPSPTPAPEVRNDDCRQHQQRQS